MLKYYLKFISNDNDDDDSSSGQKACMMGGTTAEKCPVGGLYEDNIYMYINRVGFTR